MSQPLRMSTQPQATGSGVVLLVNDNPEQLDVTNTFLSLEGLYVLAAENGRAALEMLDTIQPDIIISDVVMPEIDGIELCRRLKSDPATADIPILLISGLRYDDVGVAEGLEAGADDYLEDDCPPALLIRKIQRLIAQKKEKQARMEAEERLLHSQKMEAVGRLAGGVAHDFNNLLTAIIGYSQLLLGSFDEDDPRRRQVEEVLKASQSAASLTSQLLAFSRKQIMLTKALDLNIVISNLDRLLRRLIGEDIEIVTYLHPALGTVKADPGQIEQVILNLVINARHAMPRGGKLTIETANVELNATYAQKYIDVLPGHYVMLAISDTGAGMDKETQSHIFEPFFTTKEQGKGTGLGLSTVYGIVKQSGGHIWIYSEIGRGTTFKIYLPRIEGESESLKAVSSIAAPKGSETVLLVEDEEGVRKLARQILEMNGYTVLEAIDTSEARSICERHEEPIHLVISDVVMPKMSGPELADELLKVRPRLKVLFMSGYTDEAIINHGLLDANTAFLQKPFTPDALARKVREVLDEKEG